MGYYYPDPYITSEYRERVNLLKTFSRKMVPYLFILPSMVFLFVFYYYATSIAFINSFQNNHFGFQSSFIGISNYIKIFSDEVFIASLKNQIIYTFAAIFVNLFFPFLAAELLHFIRGQKIANIIKRMFVLPMLVPGIVTILTFKYLYGNSYGLNTILKSIGLGVLRHNWLNENSTAIWSVIFVGFPFVSGLFFLIMHSAINTIPRELSESAELDGCKKIDIIRYIHIPNLMPFISTILTLTIIGSLQNYGLVAATTGGGPGFSSMIPSLYMYKVAFGNSDLGYGSALGMFLLVVIFSLTLISRRLTRSK